MDIFLITDTQVRLLDEVPAAQPQQGFLWLDATHEEVVAAPEAWRAAVERVTGVHLYDPHLPYDPPEPFRSRYLDSYVGEIAYADAQLGRLIESLNVIPNSESISSVK